MKTKKTDLPVAPERPVDRYFNELNKAFRDPVNRVVQMLFLPLFFFGVLCAIWVIPFPQFDFLVRLNWNTFLNWGSFFIAIVIYFYLKLSPTLSYMVLLSVGIMSFFIVQLEYLEKAGGPSVLAIALGLAVLSLLALFIGKSREGTRVSGKTFGLLLTVGPIWLWHFVFQKVKIRY